MPPTMTQRVQDDHLTRNITQERLIQLKPRVEDVCSLRTSKFLSLHIAAINIVPYPEESQRISVSKQGETLYISMHLQEQKYGQPDLTLSQASGV